MNVMSEMTQGLEAGRGSENGSSPFRKTASLRALETVGF